MADLVVRTVPGDPEPEHNLDAFRAARDWASEHGHPQPDDRMLKAYGRALLAAVQGMASDIDATGECCCAGCVGMGPCDRAETAAGEKP